MTAYDGEQWSYPITASDPDGDDDLLVYSVVSHDLSNPLWEHITLTDKTLRWTPKSGEVPNGLIFKIRVTDTDPDGAYAEQTFEVPAESDVPPNDPPRFTSVPTGPAVVGQTYRYQAQAVDPDRDDLTYGINAASAALGADIDPVTGLLTWQPTTEGDTDLVVTVTDNVNGPIPQTFTLPVIRENTAPTITSVPAGPAQVESAWTYVVRATDSDPGDQGLLQYRLTSPSEQAGIIDFDEASGTLTWTPPLGTTGSQPFTIEVDDTRGGVATQEFTIGVQDPAGTGSAPAITSTPQGPAYVGRVWTYLATASDADGDPISWTVTSAPAGLTQQTFGNNLRLTWTPTASHMAAAPHTITLQADDDDPTSGYATQSFALDVADVNQPPTITSSPSGPAYVDVLWTYRVVATDPDDADTSLVYALDPSSDIPAGAIHSASGLISWTGTATGSHQIIVIVSDLRGGTTRQRFTLNVVNQPTSENRPPVIHSLPPISVRTAEPYVYQVEATDPNWDPIFYALEDDQSNPTAPAGMTVGANGRISWTPSAAGDYGVTVWVSDLAGATVSQFFTLHVFDPIAENQPPEITSEPTGPAVRGQQWSYQAAATDPNGDVISWSLDTPDVSAERIGDLSIDDGTGLLTWTSHYEGSYRLSVIASDGNNRVIQSFPLIVLSQRPAPANLPPVIRSLPPNSVRQGDVYSYPLDAYDPNADALQYELTTAPAGMTIDPSGVIRWQAGMIGDYDVTVSVSDGVNAPVEQQFPLEVLPPVAANEPPVIVSNPTGPAVRDRQWTYEVIGEDPNGDAITFSVTATDAGGDPVVMSVAPSATHPATQAVITWTPTAGGNVDVVVTATDGLRSSSQSFTLRVLDNAPPVIDSTPTQTVNLRALHQYTVHAADPNTSDVIRYALQDFRQLVAIGGLQPATTPAIVASTGQLTWTPDAPGLYEVTVSANDQRGGTDTQTYQLQVIDPNHNNPPLVDFAPRREVPFGVAMIYQVPASDPEGDPLTFTPVLSSLPPGMSLSPTGLLTWTPTAEQLSPPEYTVSLSVSDGENIVSVQAQLTVVQQLQNQPPEFTSTAPTSAIANYRYTYDAAAVDPDGDSVVFSLAGPGSPDPAPAGMTVDSLTGLIQWRPTVSQVGSHRFIVVASDTLGLRDEQVVTLTVAGANRPPVIESDPPVIAVRNELYDYTIRASDPDGHRLTYSLAPNSEISASDPNVDFDPATGRLRWTPDTLGVFYVQINVVDEFGMGVGQGYRVQVLATAPNAAPRITSSIPEPLMAEVGQAFALTVTADDPNASDTVSITMVEPGTLPGTGTFTRNDGNPASGALAWTPATAGLVWFQFQASDGQATASQRFAILVTPTNHPPTVEAIDNQTVTEGAELQVDVNATDADGDSLEYALDAASLDRGLTIDEFGRIRWQTEQGDTDPFDVIVSVTDNRIAAPLETTFRVSVVADNTSPKVTILPDRTAAEIGETVTILVHAIDDVGVAAGSKTLTLVSVIRGGQTLPLDQPLALDAAGRAQLTLTAAHLGELRFEATARDVNGNVSPTATASVFVADPTNVAAPTAVIALPTDGQAVTEPVDVVGTVTDDVAVRDWQLTYTPLDGGHGGLIAAGTAAIDNGVLGRFDPTILRNGMYRLDLVVTDTGNNTSSDSVTVEVEGSLKLGNFTLSFVDLEVPVAGLPITITRSYDTLDADVEGDFGYGWRIDVANTKVQIDYGDAPEFGLDQYRSMVTSSPLTIGGRHELHPATLATVFCHSRWLDQPAATGCH